jgi:rhodanese-related sulfurtransferase
MKPIQMKPMRSTLVTLAAVLVGAAMVETVTAQVVADSACPKYAVDDAAFATCDGDHVARADGIAFVTPEVASHMKQVHGADVLLLDVRSPIEVAVTGMASQVDALVPYQERSSAQRWDDITNDGSVERDPQFLTHVQAAVAARGGGHDMPVVVLCRDGSLALRAAEALRAAGHAYVYVVDGGFEGRFDGTERSGGWKQANLPWSAGVSESVLSRSR